MLPVEQMPSMRRATSALEQCKRTVRMTNDPLCTAGPTIGRLFRRHETPPKGRQGAQQGPLSGSWWCHRRRRPLARLAAPSKWSGPPLHALLRRLQGRVVARALCGANQWQARIL